MSVAGFVLAAGAGRRAGGPKALRRAADGRSWLQHSVDVLHAGGCGPVAVVLGAAADEACGTLSSVPAVVTLVNEGWEEGDGLLAATRARLVRGSAVRGRSGTGDARRYARRNPRGRA